MTDRRANLERLLDPRTIAMIGGDRARAAARTCRAAGFAGDLFVVNRRGEAVPGATAVRDIAELPSAPDAVFLGLSAAATPQAVEALAAMGAGGIVTYADGIDDPHALVEAAGDTALVGPNCFGIVNNVTGGALWPVEHVPQAERRGVAILAQSGNLCINLCISQRSLPFSYIVSMGNQIQLTIADFVDHLADDPAVTAIGLFMEGVPDMGAFIDAAAKARDRGKPVVACKVGRSELGAAMAMSHTASLAGADALYDALFDRLGIVRADTIPVFLEALKLATTWRPSPGRRLAVVSTSGGDAELAADHAASHGLDLAAPGSEDIAAIAALLPPEAHVSNPLDYTNLYWGNEEALTRVFTRMFAVDYDAALLIIEHPPARESHPAFADSVAATHRALIAAHDATGVDGAVASVLPESMPLVARTFLRENGIVPLSGLDTAIAAIAAVTRRDTAAALFAGVPAPVVHRAGGNAPAQVHDEEESKAVLREFGIARPRGGIVAGDAPGDLDLAFPLAVKALHPDLPHKSDAGAVILNVADAAGVEAAVASIRANVAGHAPGLAIDRFLVEEMVRDAVCEMIVGVTRDPTFGLTLTVGAGGILVELLDDAASLLLPACEADIRRAVQGLRCHRLMTGFRGRPRGDIDALVAAVGRVAAFADAWRDRLEELDVNPLFVLPEGKGVVAGDALIRAGQG